MEIPAFVLRKLYRRGSLRRIDAGRFAFTLRNPLADATVVAPPRIQVNGILYDVGDAETNGPSLAAISARQPLRFKKGDRISIALPGHLLRGTNRLHITVQTKEWGEVDLFVEEGAPTDGSLEEE